MSYYFAYGSNLHPARLTQRVPSAELVGMAMYPQHELLFHKKSVDGSGKCNMSKSDAGLIYGAIYRMDPEHKRDLDRFEGEGYYAESQILLRTNEAEYSCFTYLARASHITDSLKPYHWYKKLVLLGAQYLQFPQAYIAAIEFVESIEDPDLKRRSASEALLESMAGY